MAAQFVSYTLTLALPVYDRTRSYVIQVRRTGMRVSAGRVWSNPTFGKPATLVGAFSRSIPAERKLP